MQIAVLVPCFNEEATIELVIKDFRDAIPESMICVYDNNSTDQTAIVAEKAGAIVRREMLQGKGNVVRRMFADIEADIYVLVDGDGTYHAPKSIEMVQTLIDNNLDMVSGKRERTEASAYRLGHQQGNRMLTALVGWTFGAGVSDMLSGYRVMSRRFVKTFPAHASGFEIETELTVHALEMRMAIAEVPGPYYPRPEGSESKLSTYRDGARILRTIFNLLRDEKPLLFFASIAAVTLLAAIFLAMPILVEYVETGLVPRFPTAMLSMGLALVAMVAFTAGLILDSVVRGRRELKRMHYLGMERFRG
jgi:glycosyltransferase involved in cell wall biosynthesis